MVPLALWLMLAAGAPAAEPAAGPLAAYPRECGKPRKAAFTAADFAPALEKLRASNRRLVPRAWAMTCERQFLCNTAPLADRCTQLPTSKVPQGNPVDAGELLILVDDPDPGARPSLYAVIAKYGPRAYSTGYPARPQAVAIVDGPPLGEAR